MFIWVANFRGLTAGFAGLSTLLRTFIAGYICLTKNKIWVFHPGWRFAPILLHPNIRSLPLLLFYTTVSLDFGCCFISELTTHSSRMANNSTMHPHPTRRDVIVHMNAIMPFHVYNIHDSWTIIFFYNIIHIIKQFILIHQLSM